jgi:predicted lipoprotein with Yx(FWY)xxD motif
MIRSLARRETRKHPRILLALLAATAAAVALAACGSSGTSSSGSGGSSPAAASTGGLKTAQIGGITVLTNAKGFTLYSFAPDTSTTSNCNGACAKFWPPVKGDLSASGVKGTFSTIKRADGSTQASFDGHPLYTYVGDKAPGQAKGNGLNLSGGVWHEVTTSGSAPASSSSSGSGGGGY